MDQKDLTGITLGDFKILRLLGQGGMGQVYLAEQISLKRKVALKLMRSELAANETAKARFWAEAEAVAKTSHANIVQIYAIDKDLGFMALEFVEGRNLREYLDKKRTVEVLLGLSIMRQVANALQRASELGIIHRDIKPENILLTRKGEVKVTDFGLSRIFGEDGTPALNLTKSDVTLGTPLYMSPEQVEGKKQIDHRSDIYSFGVTCYHMFSGHPPFQGTTAFEVAVQHVQKDPQPLQEIRPDLPPELVAIIHKMMAKSPEDRYQLGREIIRDVSKLQHALVGAGQTLSVSPSLGTTPTGTQTLGLEATLPMLRGTPSPWPRRLLLAALPLVFGGGLLFTWAANRPNVADSAAPPAKVEEPPLPAPGSLAMLEKEKALLTRIQDANAKPLEGLKPCIELSLLYLNDRQRFGDAEKFFNDLTGKQQFAYKNLGRLGLAMLSAFKDEPEKSNKLFLSVLDKDKNDKDKANPFWKNSFPLREMMAKALTFNLQNNPAVFPEKLRPFLHPPAATVK